MSKSEARIPMYQQVMDALVERIRTGAFAAGEPFCTEAALVEEFSVSRITARRALDELEAQGLITRKRGVGCFVSRSAQELLSEDVQTHAQGAVYALLLPDTLPRPRIQAFFDGANEALSARDCHAAVYLTGAQESAPAVLERLSGMDIAGAILLTDDPQPCGNALNKLLLSGKAVILAGCGSPFAHISSVQFDMVTSADALVQRLHALGHERVAYFAESLTNASYAAQHKLAAMLLALQSENVYSTDDPKALRQCIAAGATAFVAENGEVAHHLARDCMAMGLYIPGMVSLACLEECDPLPPIRRKEAPLRLTCLQAPYAAMGKATAEMALERTIRPIAPAERKRLPLLLAPGDTTFKR